MNLRKYIRQILEEVDKKSLKSILNSDEAYEILDASPASGTMWTEGGCAILAFALNKAFGYPVYVIYDNTLGQVDHFVAKAPDGSFVDYYGPQKNIVSNFKRREMLYDRKLVLMPYDSSINISDIVIDDEASEKLAELIKSKEGLNEIKKFGSEKFPTPEYNPEELKSKFLDDYDFSKHSFNTGDCDIYAVSLHRLYGYPLYVVRGWYEDDLGEDNDFNYEDCHIVVKMPNGLYLDSEGEQGEQELRQNARFMNDVHKITIVPISEEEALNTFSCQDQESEIKQVMNYIKKKDKLNENEEEGKVDKIKYEAYFVDKPSLLKQIFPPIYPNTFYHHMTIALSPKELEYPDAIGQKIKLPIIGRITTDRVDALLVDSKISKNNYPHITLSTAEGVKPFESNIAFKQTPEQIEYFDSPMFIDVTYGYFNGEKDVK